MHTLATCIIFADSSNVAVAGAPIGLYPNPDAAEVFAVGLRGAKPCVMLPAMGALETERPAHGVEVPAPAVGLAVLD